MSQSSTSAVTASEQEEFRPNVGILLVDGKGRVLLGKRRDDLGWQMPQGGIEKGESCEQAMYRELREELGLERESVELIIQGSEWLYYRIPEERRMLATTWQRRYAGQKQRWFLLHFQGTDRQIRLDCEQPPEFCEWAWVSYWYPLAHIIDFKRDLYSRVLKEFCPAHVQLCRRLQEIETG